ncbi:Alpha/Beta hydrolase protein [Hyaloraphidium curvatum]|nr:Alpha/Beta hydrolase protein [Hyaloraphidium curvatum]
MAPPTALERVLDYAKDRPVLTAVGCTIATATALFLRRLYVVKSPTAAKPWASWPPKKPASPAKESGVSVEIWKEEDVDIEVWVRKAGSDAKQGLPPLVFLHGGFHNASCYENYLVYFSRRGFDCYSLSLRDHGASTKVPGKELFHSLRDCAWDLGVVVGRLLREGSKPPIIFGHSKGSAVCQHFLSYHPRNLANFPTYCSGFVHFNGFPPSPHEILPFKNWARLDFWNLAAGILVFNPFWSLKSPEVAARVFYSSATSKEHARAEWEKLERIEAGPDPESLTTPYCVPETLLQRSPKVFVVGAVEDVLMDPKVVAQTFETFDSAAERMGGKTPSGVEVVVIRVTVPGGHCHMVEPIWEDGAKIIADTLLNSSF